MEGLVTYLFFGLFFYLMMRFGCGAHMVHGHGRHPMDPPKPAVDPVCGTEVKADAGYALTHEGRTYRFCSRQCRDQFEAQPEAFVSAKEDRS